MILETDRLIIRKFTHEDIDLIYDINNNPECIKFNGWDSMSYEDCKSNIKKWINQYSKFPGTGAFCVEDKEEKVKIGMAFIVPIDKYGEFEVGFRLRRTYWNRGYAKEITCGFISYSKKLIKLLMDEARKKGVSKIILNYTDEGYHLYKSLGFKETDTQMEYKL